MKNKHTTLGPTLHVGMHALNENIKAQLAVLLTHTVQFTWISNRISVAGVFVIVADGGVVFSLYLLFFPFLSF